MNATEKDFVSPKEIAQRLGVSYKTVLRWLKENKPWIRRYRIGRRDFYFWRDVKKRINQTRKKTIPPPFYS